MLRRTFREVAGERIAAASRPYDAKELAAQSARVEGRANVRAAVMARLPRGKYTRHPELAEILIGTGTARIHYSGSDSWITLGDRDTTGQAGSWSSSDPSSGPNACWAAKG